MIEIGSIIGRWTVISGPYLLHNAGIKRASFWKCKCACGRERMVRGGSLVRGKTKSCGCYRHVLVKKNNIIVPKLQDKKLKEKIVNKKNDFEKGLDANDEEWMNKWKNHRKNKIHVSV